MVHLYMQGKKEVGLKESKELGMVVYTSNSMPQEAETKDHQALEARLSYTVRCGLA